MNKVTFKQRVTAEIPFLLAVPAVLWQILFFYIPLLFIIALSFIYIIDCQKFALTLQAYRELLQPIYSYIIIRSVLLALTVSLLCLVIGFPIAYYIGLKKRSLKNIFLSFLILPFWTNLLVHVYAWFFVLEKNGFFNNILLYLGIIKSPLSILNSLTAVILVMFYCYLPFMILPLVSILEKIDTRLVEASLDLGATHRQTFFKVILPLSFPGLQTGFLLVFVPAFGEFVIPLLLGGDKYMYVGTLISHYFLVTQNTSVGTAFTIGSSFILLCSAFITYIIFKKLISLQR